MSPGAHHRRGVALMLASAACFTTNVLLIRWLADFEAANVWLISCVRFVVGLGLILTVYGRAWQPTHLVRNRKLIERGLLGGLGVAGYYYTVVVLGAGRATFINNTYVIWGGLLAVLILREHFRLPLAIGSVLALTGLGFLTGAFATGAQVTVFDLIAIVVAVGSGYIVVTIRQLHATEHSSTIFAAQCTYGLLLCAAPAMLQWSSHSGMVWLILGIAGVFAGAGQLMMTRAFRDLSVAEGSLLQMSVPLGIAVGEVLFFSARFSVAELVGGALILAGCALPALQRRS